MNSKNTTESLIKIAMRAAPVTILAGKIPAPPKGKRWLHRGKENRQFRKHAKMAERTGTWVRVVATGHPVTVETVHAEGTFFQDSKKVLRLNGFVPEKAGSGHKRSCWP